MHFEVNVVSECRLRGGEANQSLFKIKTTFLWNGHKLCLKICVTSECLYRG